jgi:plasmid stabilization system protein ParE
MKYKYRFDPIAANEYEAAYSWYTERSQKAGDRFITTVEEAIDTICENPYRYRKSYKELREVILKKYPFYLIYSIDEKKKTILIVSVYHQKRNPDKKYLKTP